MTAYHLYRTLRFWAIAGLPSWGVLMLAKYLGIFGEHAFDFSGYFGLGFMVLWALAWFSIGKMSVPDIPVKKEAKQ